MATTLTLLAVSIVMMLVAGIVALTWPTGGHKLTAIAIAVIGASLILAAIVDILT